MLDSRLCVISSNIGVYMKNRGKRITDMRNELIEGVTFSAGKKNTQKKDKYIPQSAHVQDNNATLKEIPRTQQETNLIFRQLLP